MDPFLSRDFLIFVPQLIIATIFIVVAFLILRRNRNRLSITLSGFYITIAIGLIFNAIDLLVSNLQPENEFLIVIIYYVGTAFPLIYAFSFLIMFIISLLRVDLQFTLRQEILFLIVYGVLDILIFFFPGGITLLKDLDWRPLYSWEFLITVYIYFTVSMTAPTVYFSIKLVKTFEAKNLKKRIKIFITGIYLTFIIFYGVTLYNTWHDPFFRNLWSLMTIILLTSSAILIYYGIIQKL